jgi:hypothetical protein
MIHDSKAVICDSKPVIAGSKALILRSKPMIVPSSAMTRAREPAIQQGSPLPHEIEEKALAEEALRGDPKPAEAFCSLLNPAIRAVAQKRLPSMRPGRPQISS